MDDIFESTLEDCSWDGKLYAIPYMYHPGNAAVIYVNQNLLEAKGITLPTDAWTTDQFNEIAHQDHRCCEQDLGHHLLSG